MRKSGVSKSKDRAPRRCASWGKKPGRVTPSAIRVSRKRSHAVRKEEQKAAGASDRRERIPQPQRQIGRQTRKRTSSEAIAPW